MQAPSLVLHVNQGLFDIYYEQVIKTTSFRGRRDTFDDGSIEAEALYPEVDSPGCHSTNVEQRGLCAERRAWAQSAALVAVAPIHLPPRPASSSPTLPLELKVHPALEPRWKNKASVNLEFRGPPKRVLISNRYTAMWVGNHIVTTSPGGRPSRHSHA